ncbi:enoyl-CoA hydratase [Lewinella marina]|uniref:Enoyl-CoA hydratase n=1 Tax=Neolewinella marina TaxID=438751 RepID=A0A2G0CI48_9BACT|nr:enoyl-CoA hydratase-related protein [Neolewinella marina]NJB85213.1 enoyl-CoA hydratase [Neolewinella marina]PHK99654.1 enoyl-CoA hydratase [Neolewinella marina]
MSYNNLLVEVEDRVVFLTINRPRALNALNDQTFEELRHFFSTGYRECGDFHGVLLTGAGDRAFVAGADIKEFLDVAEQGNGEQLSRRGQEVFFLIERFHRPVIALVNGFALGGGCELAMACHLRVATENASFGQPEVNLGIIPGYGGTQRLNQYIGKGKTMELILTGDRIGAEEAHRLGLVNYTLPRDEAREKALELLRVIGSKGPVAVAQSIRLVNAYYGGDEGFHAESAAFGETAKTEDFREGASAFIEKRIANFRGK